MQVNWEKTREWSALVIAILAALFALLMRCDQRENYEWMRKIEERRQQDTLVVSGKWTCGQLHVKQSLDPNWWIQVWSSDSVFLQLQGFLAISIINRSERQLTVTRITWETKGFTWLSGWTGKFVNDDLSTEVAFPETIEPGGYLTIHTLVPIPLRREAGKWVRELPSGIYDEGQVLSEITTACCLYKRKTELQCSLAQLLVKLQLTQWGREAAILSNYMCDGLAPYSPGSFELELHIEAGPGKQIKKKLDYRNVCTKSLWY